MNRTAVVWLLGIWASVGAAQDTPAPALRSEVGDPDEVRAFLESIPQRLLAEGPSGWLKVFSQDPQFFMASDGVVAFADFEPARDFLAEFAPSVKRIELEWIEPRWQILTPDLALVAANDHEEIEWNSAESIEFGGYFSGLAVREADGWKLRHLHRSRPISAADSEAVDEERRP